MLPLRFDKDGLIPVVTQDAASGEVLMLAFMNEEALRLTQETRLVHYWSRGRNSLWMKGETSGNRQHLISLHVNCELNSLLLKVMQDGAVCHDGFDTCYYRSLQCDGTLQTERDRVFDPTEVYGKSHLADVATGEPVRDQFGAYEYLRDHDLTEVSSTSRQLRAHDSRVLARVSDELIELAAVIRGEHMHQDRMHDIILETSQIIYWIYVSSLGTGLTWQQLRPDIALAIPDQGVSADAIQNLLRQYAARWTDAVTHGLRDGALSHGTLSIIAQTCRAEDIDPLTVVAYDLRELRCRSYLDGYFETLAAASPAS